MHQRKSFIYPGVQKHILFIVNNVITASCFPDVWKQAKLVPLPKIKNPVSVSDFRPISILSCLSKVVEKILKEQVVEHLNKFNLLDVYQSAYRKGHSTTSAVLNIVDDVRRNADHNKATILVLLDFKKAFDSINHDTLIGKLRNNFNFSTTACCLIKNYLCDRKFRVASGKTLSALLTNTCGVPQGSVLGPLLFSLYINDLADGLRNCCYHLFADDVQIYTSCLVGSINQTIGKINENILEIENWAIQNNLKLNPKKTQAIIIYKHKIDTCNLPPVSVCNENIPYSNCVNSLGIFINNCLSWDEHIDAICSKTYMGLRKLWPVPDFASRELRQKLFMTFVFSYFLYGESVFFGMTHYNMDKLNKAFNAGIRYIFRLRKYDHISLFLTSTLGCTLCDYFAYRTCLAIYRILFTKTPMYLFSKFEKSNLARNNMLILPRNKCTILNSSFYVKGVGLWNRLPYSVKSATSCASFKKLYFLNL